MCVSGAVGKGRGIYIVPIYGSKRSQMNLYIGSGSIPDSSPLDATMVGKKAGIAIWEALQELLVFQWKSSERQFRDFSKVYFRFSSHFMNDSEAIGNLG